MAAVRAKSLAQLLDIIDEDTPSATTARPYRPLIADASS
jgi:hypothetical protein